MSDKKIQYLISLSTLAALLLSFFIPGEPGGRITVAVVLVISACFAHAFLKKRNLLSIFSKQVLLLMAVAALLCLSLLYLSGLHFGFYRNPYALNPSVFLTHVLPTAVILLISEYLRGILLAQSGRWTNLISYGICVLCEVLILGGLSYINTHTRFMDFMGMALFPALISNLLFHYLAKRYGILPNIVYRAILALYVYIIPIKAGMPDALLAFAKVFVPLAIYFFIDALYEKKKRYALKKKSKLAVVFTVLAIVVMASVMMLISNRFRFGALVVATPSMTGELNVGDVVIFEQHVTRNIEKGQVIVFEKEDSVVIHRVIKIETINGVTRYYTKGDANEENDSGFILTSDIIGYVDYKIPYVGYPTLWLRDLFAGKGN